MTDVIKGSGLKCAITHGTTSDGGADRLGIFTGVVNAKLCYLNARRRKWTKNTL